MSSRAELQRTVFLVVALLMTAGATSALAREFRDADVNVFHSPQLGEEKETPEQTRTGVIDLNRTNVVLTGNTRPVREMMCAPGAPPLEHPYGLVPTAHDTKPFEAAITAVCARTQRDPDPAQLIERIRKVE